METAVQPSQPEYDPYAQPGQFSPQQKTSGYATAAMVVGIVGLVSSCCFFPIYYIVGLVGLLWLVPAARREIAAGMSGEGMATAGFVLSLINLAIGVMMTLFYVASIASGN